MDEVVAEIVPDTQPRYRRPVERRYVRHYVDGQAVDVCSYEILLQPLAARFNAPA
jgi:hypothetical protein